MPDTLSVRKFAVIGHPIGHTMSPFIHQRLFALDGYRVDYQVFDIPPEQLRDKVEKELSRLDGYNITIPHKQAIIPLLDRLSEKASLYQSVNTVKNGTVSQGYTTDPEGFVKALQNAGIPLAGRVVILGCGGVARVMAYEAAQAGCRVTIATRPSGEERAKRLIADARAAAPGGEFAWCRLEEVEGDIDLLVNGTPVGMFPKTEGMPVEKKVLERTRNLFDSVYNPGKTMLMKYAEACGSRVLGGMSMLVWQAVASHQIWDGSVYRPSDIEGIIREAQEEMARKFASV